MASARKQDENPTGTALEIVDFGNGEPIGFENVRIEEQTTPFLNIAQGLSPELNPGKGEHIPGLALGSIFDTAIREPILGQPGVSLIVCHRHYHYGLWIPRDLGGGFRGAFEPNDPLVVDTLDRIGKKYGPRNARFRLPRYTSGRWSDTPVKTPDTDEDVEMVETGNLYIMYSPLPQRVDEMTARYAIVRFTSTKLGPYNDYVTRHLHKKWSYANGKVGAAPIYQYRWVLSTWQDKRKKGEFFNWTMALDNVTGDEDRYRGALVSRAEDPIYPLAVEFHDQAKNDLIKPDYDAVPKSDVDPEAAPF